MDKRRLFIILCSITVFAVISLGRLFWIQVVSQTSIALPAVKQRQTSIVLDPGRGHFYDRHGSRLTGEVFTGLVVWPNHGETFENDHTTGLLENLNLSKHEWLEQVQGNPDPVIIHQTNSEYPLELSREQVRYIEGLHLPYGFTAPIMKRYYDNSVARHLIGYVNQYEQTGAAGLERTFNDWLQGIGATTLSLHRDANLNPIQGLGFRMHAPDNPFYPAKVITTLDMHLQRLVEDAMDELHISTGAVVVLDAMDSDMYAMASRPQFNPIQVDPHSSHWNNLALHSTAPGSVYKLLLAAVALEEQLYDRGHTFHCNGSYGKYGFSCWKEGGHGEITLEEAFAQSCNIAFAQIAMRIDPELLERYAEELGLIAPVGWSANQSTVTFRQFDQEQRGQLFAPTTKRQDEGVRIQTAIGQRDVRISPLQAANLVNTILHSGQVKQVRVVKEIRYNNESTWVHFKPQYFSQNNMLSSSTVRQLRRMMERVVQDGTGAGLKNFAWNIAGKTGTAELSTAEGERTNQWFVGYVPAKEPKFTIAVLVRTRENASHDQSIQLFRKIVDALGEIKTN